MAEQRGYLRYTKNKEEKRQRFQLIPNFVRLNNDRKKMVEKYDYLVIGSGIAGMSFALKVANEGRSVALICKAGQEEANTLLTASRLSCPDRTTSAT